MGGSLREDQGLAQEIIKSQLACEHFGVSPKDLEEVAEWRKVWGSLFRLSSLISRQENRWMEEWMFQKK